MSQSAYQIVLTSCPDPACAQQIARILVTEGLAACVNIFPAMTSIYTWKDKMESTTEHLLLIKSQTCRYPAIQERLRALHPYELPEIIAVPITHGLPDYLAWLNLSDKS